MNDLNYQLLMSKNIVLETRIKKINDKIRLLEDEVRALEFENKITSFFGDYDPNKYHYEIIKNIGQSYFHWEGMRYTINGVKLSKWKGGSGIYMIEKEVYEYEKRR